MSPAPKHRPEPRSAASRGLFVVIALWLSEWLQHWTRFLGPLEQPLGWLWLAVFLVLVARTRSRTRRSDAQLAWLWMLAILLATTFSTTILAWTEDLTLVTPADLAVLELKFPAEARDQLHLAAEWLNLLAHPLVAGLAAALLTAFNTLVVGLGLTLGRLVGELPAARVGKLPRLALALLQLPTLLLIPAIGVALIAGTIAMLVHPQLLTRPELVALRPQLWQVIFVGAALWSLGAVHLARLLRLADGRPLTRTILALFAVLPAAGLMALRPGLTASATILAWLALQLAALALARKPAQA